MSKLSSDTLAETKAFNSGAILSSVFVVLVLLANIVSTKIVAVGGWAFDAGTILYPLTFAIKDMIQKRYGRQAARKVIWTTFGLMAFAFAIFWLVSALPADATWLNQEAYDKILTPLGRIVVASITAGIISELLDTQVFSWLWRRTNQIWVAFLSNIVGLAVDTVIFCLIAFYGAMPTEVVVQIAIVNFVGKFLISTLALPSILLVKPTTDKLV